MVLLFSIRILLLAICCFTEASKDIVVVAFGRAKELPLLFSIAYNIMLFSFWLRSLSVV